jgi:hypothetical protein
VLIGIVACSQPHSRTSPGAPTAKAAVTRYYRAVAAQDYSLAFSYLAADATGPDRRLLTSHAFVTLAREMDAQEGRVVGFSVGVFQSLVVMTIERKKVGVYHAHLRVSRRGGTWRIIAIDRV